MTNSKYYSSVILPFAVYLIFSRSSWLRVGCGGVSVLLDKLLVNNLLLGLILNHVMFQH